MIGFKTHGLSGLGSACALCSSLGATATAGTLPDRYLVPMTKTQINEYIQKELAKGTNSVFYTSDCKSMNWSGSRNACFRIILQIEGNNLYFVNGIITYEALQQQYAELAKGYSAIPTFNKAFLTQLKEAGKVFVGAVMGFISQGPIGIFTGTASAAKQVIAESRAKKIAAFDTKVIQPSVQKIQSGLNERARIEEQNRKDQQLASIKQALPLIIGSVVLGGIMYFYGDDIKKFANKKL